MSVKVLWSQNKHIFITAFSIFVVSLGIILFFTPSEGTNYLQTDVLHTSSTETSESAGDQQPQASTTSADNDYEKLLTIKENPYFVLDKDGKIIFASGQFAKIAGEDSKSLKGVFLFDLIAKEHRENVFANYRDAFANKSNVLQTGPFRIEFNSSKSVVFMSFIAVPNSEEILIEVNDVTDDLQELDKKMQDVEQENTDETRVIVKQPSL